MVWGACCRVIIKVKQCDACNMLTAVVNGACEFCSAVHSTKQPDRFVRYDKHSEYAEAMKLCGMVNGVNESQWIHLPPREPHEAKCSCGIQSGYVGIRLKEGLVA